MEERKEAIWEILRREKTLGRGSDDSQSPVLAAEVLFAERGP